MDENRIKKLMKTLEIPRDEAIEIIKQDEQIDKGAKLNELSPEQKKIAKKYTITGTRKSHSETGVYNWNTQGKTRENPTKEKIISELFDFLPKYSSFEIKNCQITNKTRQISFEIGEKKFEFTLVEKRPPKK